MVDMSNFIDFTFIKLKQIKLGEGVKLSTFKKDRHLTIIKEEEFFTLYEEGYSKETFSNLDKKDLKKLLKTLARKEFPRSNMLHLNIVKK
ncbi:MAG: hypothetical protein ACRC6T_06715 [Sarcina sp.]